MIGAFVALSGPLLHAEESAAARELGLPYLDRFDPSDYQGHTQVWSAVEDSRGVVYFGNYEGALEYDGARWGKVAVPGGAWVRSLAIDSHDVLWMGGVDEIGYAALSGTGERTFVSLRGNLPPESHAPGEIWRTYTLPDGVLFQSNTWILYWTNNHFETLKTPAAGSWQLVPVGQEFWLTNSTHGWFRLKIAPRQLALEPLEPGHEFSTTNVAFALSDSSGSGLILGAGKAGLLHWDGKVLTPFATDVDPQLKNARMYRAITLPDGRFAISTLEDGVFILDHAGHVNAHLMQDSGLPDNTVLNLVADRRGGMWICLDRGVVHADVRPWITYFGPALGTGHSNYDAPFLFQNRRYVVSNEGLFNIVPATPSAPPRVVPIPVFNHEFLNFAEPAYDGILVGSDNGMFFWQGGAESEKIDQTANIFSATPSVKQPGRWFALADDHLYTYRYENGKWTSEGRVEGLDHIRSALETEDGTWWFGTPANGAYRVTFPNAGPTGPGKPVTATLGREAGLPENHGWVRIVSDHGVPLMLCNTGLYLFNPSTQRFERTGEFGPEGKAGAFSVRTETNAPAGMWLVAKPPGLQDLIAPLTLGLGANGTWSPLDIPQLRVLDDVSTVHLEGSDAAHGGILWVTGQGGLFRIDVDGWRHAAAVPATAVILRRAEDESGAALPLSGGWQLPHRMRGIRLSYSAPGLTRDHGLRYESVLESGSDRSVTTDMNPGRDFSALASGDYRLTIRAIGNQGIWSQPLVVSFSVLPPWWLSIWAWVGYVIAGFLIVVAAVRERTRELTRRAEILEGVIAARTEELRRSNVELAHLHKLELDEKIEARLSESKARLELLRYQLNPHFLMNAFTVLRSLVHSKPDDAANMVGKLADFCRIALTRTDADGGSVDDEAQLIETYLGAEKARWRNDLMITMTVDPDVTAFKIPPFLLQPLVENAIKYGGRTSELPLQVKISLTKIGKDGVRIEVANTGKWVEPNAPERMDSTGIGLDNLRQRLARYYPKSHSLRTEAVDGWVRMILELSTQPKDPFVRQNALV